MPTRRRRQFLQSFGATATIGLTGIAGCLDDGPVAETQEVKLTNDGFEPLNIKVDRKQFVYWENVSDSSYLLLSATDTWDYRQPIDAGNTSGHEFSRSGIYRLVAREPAEDGEDGEETTTTTPEFTGARMKIAVGREMDDPVTE